MAAHYRREGVALYALDALDRRDRIELDRHLEECEICRDELETVLEAASALAVEIEPAEPPESLRNRLILRAGSEPQELVRRRRSPGALGGRRSTLMLAGIAAALSAVGLFATGPLYRLLDHPRAGVGIGVTARAFLARRGTHRTPLRGASGVLAFDAHGAAVLVVHHLPRAPRGRTYEIWILTGTRVIPAGLFNGGGTNSVVTLTARLANGASVVAVSIEPVGGSRSPRGPLRFAAANV